MTKTPADAAAVQLPGQGTAAGPGVARHRVATLTAMGLLFVLTVAPGPAATFYFDAQAYWSASLSLLNGGSVAETGLLALRGVLTFAVYAPAAVLEHFIGGTGHAAVLVENALIIAVVGAVVLPAIGAALGVRGPVVVYACAAMTWILVARFAPYPLMDVPAAGTFFCALLFASRRSPRSLAVAGLLAGVTINLRPAYLLPLAAVVAGVALIRRLRCLWLVPGGVAALVPQSIFGLAHGYGWFPTPPLTATQSGFQAGVGSYIVRFDGVLSARPAQFYCHPHMAAIVADHPVTSTGEFVHTLVANMPWSIGFVLEKFAATFAWSARTPYALAPSEEDYGYLLPVAAVTVCGVLSLAALVIRRRRRGALGGYPVLILAAVVGMCATIVASAPEMRFALPVVLVGILGTSLTLATVVRRDRTMNVVWPVTAAAGTGLIAACAYFGLAHPAPADVTLVPPQACARY